MRSALLRLVACLLMLASCLAAFPLVGCVSAPSVSAPAFVKDVDTERKDREDADLKIREDLGGAIEQLRADVTEARAAGEKAFADAIASGKSMGEAMADQVRAETAVAIQTSQAAIAKSKAETDAAVTEAKARADAAAAAAKHNGEGSPGWLSWVLGLLGTTGAGGVIAKLLLSSYDRKPFVGTDGTPISEGPLVDAARALLGAGRPAALPAAPAATAASPTV